MIPNTKTLNIWPLSVALATLATLSSPSRAAISFTGSPVAENFDTLPTAPTTTPVSTALNPVVGTENALGGTTFVGGKLSGTGTTLNLIADNGGSNTGALYSYGVAGSTERALGALASAGAITGFGLEIVNNTGAELTSIGLSFDREVWRSSTSATNVLSFYFATTNVTSATLLDVPRPADYIANTAFDLVGLAPVTTNGALDGNLNALNVSGTLSGFSLAAGASLFLRWEDMNELGNDAGIAIDNLIVGIPEPSSLIALFGGLGMLLGFRRMRSRLA